MVTMERVHVFTGSTRCPGLLAHALDVWEDIGGHTIEAAAAATRAAAGEHEALGAYSHQGSWLESVERLKNTGDQGHERFEAVAVGYQNDDGDGKRLEVLLEFDVLIGGEDGVEFGGGLS